MLRLSRWFAVALLAFVPLSARAQTYCPPVVVAPVATVSYYAPAPTVAYYAPAPVVVYRPPLYVAPPVFSFNFGYGGYGGYYGGYHHHSYRHGRW